MNASTYYLTINIIKMNNAEEQVKEPELKKILNSLENLTSRFDGLTLNFKDKINSIYNPPQLEPENKSLDVLKEEPKPGDMISCINNQLSKLRIYSNRMEEILVKLNRII